MMLKLLEKIFLSLKVESGIFLSYPNTPTTSRITSSQVLTITPLGRGKLLIPPSSLKKRKKIGREGDEREKTMVQESATTTSVLRVLPSVSPNILKLLVPFILIASTSPSVLLLAVSAVYLLGVVHLINYILQVWHNVLPGIIFYSPFQNCFNFASAKSF